MAWRKRIDTFADSFERKQRENQHEDEEDTIIRTVGEDKKIQKPLNKRWKLATVIMLPKSNKDKRFPQTYGPINLLSGMKVAERITESR